MNALNDILSRMRAAVPAGLLPLRAPYPSTAVEVDGNDVVLVRLKMRRRGRPLLEAHAVRPLDPDAIPQSIFEPVGGSQEALAARLAQLFAATGTRPGRVSLVLPDNLAKISLLQLPERPASARQLDELVRSKMRRAVPFRLDEASLSYQLLPAEGRGVALLVVLVRSGLVERFEQAFAACGARLGLVDISTPNLINLHSAKLADASRGENDAALLNSAKNYFSLVIVRDDRVIFFRCKTFAIDPAEGSEPNGVLAREVSNSFSYYREKLSGKGVGTVFVRTAVNGFEEIEAKLRRLEIGNVVALDPLAGLELSGGERIDAATAQRLAPALGAATGRVG